MKLNVNIKIYVLDVIEQDIILINVMLQKKQMELILVMMMTHMTHISDDDDSYDSYISDDDDDDDDTNFECE